MSEAVTTPIETPTAPADAKSDVAPATTPPAETKAPEKVTSDKYLELSRREAEFARKEAARKQEMADIQNKLKDYEEKVKLLQEIKETYKQDPEAALNRIGLTYDELTTAVLEYSSKKPATQEREVIREEIDARLKQQELAAQQAKQQELEAQRDAAISGFRNEISEFLKGNNEKYPLMQKFHKTLGESETPEDIIYGAIEAHYNETGELLEFGKVADTAEEWFREEWGKLNGTPAKSEEPPAEAKSENVPPTQEEAQPLNASLFKVKDRATPNTLTNNMSRPKYRQAYDPKGTQRRDAIERAVKALEDATRRPQ